MLDLPVEVVAAVHRPLLLLAEQVMEPQALFLAEEGVVVIFLLCPEVGLVLLLKRELLVLPREPLLLAKQELALMNCCWSSPRREMRLRMVVILLVLLVF